MSCFVDRLHTAIAETKSYLVAGFDPVLENIPEFIVSDAFNKARSDEEGICEALKTYLGTALEAVTGRVAAIKPNIAFFEQYGLGGLKAFTYICAAIKDKKIPLVIDAKRGDIGSTAKAYSTSFLGKVKAHGRSFAWIDADALTVNPYLGFDTLEPFLADCKEFGKGIFVLVKTSNPGSADIQGLAGADGTTVSDQVCGWIARHADELNGKCGFSGLGAVVGATYPDEARQIRARIPIATFLIPGLGAQGGKAEDALAGFSVKAGNAFAWGVNPGAGIVNVSRGLFEGKAADITALKTLIASNADKFNAQLAAAAQR